MKNPNGRHFIEVKDKRFLIHQTENVTIRLRDEPISLRTKYRVQNEKD